MCQKDEPGDLDTHGVHVDELAVGYCLLRGRSECEELGPRQSLYTRPYRGYHNTVATNKDRNNTIKTLSPPGTPHTEASRTVFPQNARESLFCNTNNFKKSK